MPYYIRYDHEPGEYLIFFLGRLSDYAYRPSRIRDNMRKETRYGKRVPHISSPSCSSYRLKSIMQIIWALNNRAKLNT